MQEIGTVNQVKNHNVSLVKNALRSIPYGTKNTVAQITGLSIATCNTILNELEKSGELLVMESDAATIGRPPKVYQFNSRYSYICCIFPTHENKVKQINYAVVDLLGEIVLESSVIYEHVTYKEIEEVVASLIRKEPKIKTISFGIPGYYYDGKIQSSGIDELENCNIIEQLEASFQCPVFAENDMNAMAYGIYNRDEESAEDATDLVLISFFKDRGAGAALILNGKIVKGNTNFAGEINHLPYLTDKAEEVLNTSRDEVVKFAAAAVESFAAIVNPSRVIFTGENISESMLAEIRESCREYIPEEHLPKLLYGRDFRKYYIWGLTAIAQEKTDL